MADAPRYPKPWANCEQCTLRDEPGPVYGHGNPHAKIVSVGEAPGGDEVSGPPAKWRPFIGGAGRILAALASHAGLFRCSKRHEGPCDPQPEVFETNVVKCRPPNNRLPTDLEIMCCAHALIKEIDDADPNVIIALGDVPLHVLTGNKGIGTWRGVPIEGYAGRKVFPTWHPAFIARSQHNWPFSVHDLVRAKAQAAFPEIVRVPFELELHAVASRDGGALLRDARATRRITFDYETTGLDPTRSAIRMVGFTTRGNRAEVYDWGHTTHQLQQAIFDDPSIEVCGQNILYFDLPYAEEKGINIDAVWPRVFDTMVAFHLCNSSYGQTSVSEQNAQTFRVRGSEKDLSMIASCHTDIPHWKSKENYRDAIRDVCGKDVIATHRSAYTPETGIKAELASYDMLDLYYHHVLPVHPVLHRMTKRGFKIDEEKGAAWSILMEQKANQLTEELREGLGDPHLNLNSPKQLMDLLYGKLGLPTQYVMDKKRGMRPTANATAIETLANLAPENQVLRHLTDIRHLQKMKSTYVDKGVELGRLHPRFGVSKAATGRFNSWDPNAQNVPEDMRDIWIADSLEHVVMASDWSQVEWRLSVILSGDPVGIELLTRGVDNHKAVASEALSIPYDEVTDLQRHAAKFIVYGLGYGRGAVSIAQAYNLDIKFVERFIARFFARFAVFAAWRERNIKFVQKNHYLANAFKRRRWWYTWAITEVYNFPQQSNAADMMYEALVAVDNALPKDATLRLTVHDELVANVPKDCARESWDAMRGCMERTWPQIVEASADPATVRHFYPNGWYCPADIHVGHNWKMAKSKDPDDKAARSALEKELGLA